MAVSPASSADDRGAPLASSCDAITELAAHAALIVAPLLYDADGDRPFEPFKVVAIRSLAAVALFAWVLRGVERSSAAERARSRPHRSPIFIAACALVAVHVLASACSLSPTLSLWGTGRFLQGTYSLASYVALFAALAVALRSERRRERLVTTIVVASIPVCLYAIAQRFGIDPVGVSSDPRRVTSTFGVPVFLASYVTLVLPLTLARLWSLGSAPRGDVALAADHARQATFYAGVLALQTLTLLSSQSRASFLGALAGGYVLALIVLLRRRRSSSSESASSPSARTSTVVYAALFGASVVTCVAAGALACSRAVGKQGSDAFGISSLALAGVIAVPALLGVLLLRGVLARRPWTEWSWSAWLGAGAAGIVALLALSSSGIVGRDVPFAGRLATLTQTSRGTGAARQAMWSAAVALVKSHAERGIPSDAVAPIDRLESLRPWIGTGPECTASATSIVYPPQLAHLEGRGTRIERVHNDVLDGLVATGWVGALASLALWLSVVLVATNVVFGHGRRASVRVFASFVLPSALAGALLAWWFDQSGVFVSLGFGFGLLGGVLAHWVARATERVEPDSARDDGAHPWLVAGVLAALVGHFVQLQFSFSTATTSVYFWLYLALVAAAAREARAPSPATREIDATELAPSTHVGFVVALIAGVLTFGASAAQPELGARELAVVGAVLATTWLVGAFLVIEPADPARERELRKEPRALRRYALVSGATCAALVAASYATGLGTSMSAGASAGDGSELVATFRGGSFVLLVPALVVTFVALQRRRELAFALRGSSRRWPLAALVAAGLCWLVWCKNVGVARASELAKCAASADSDDAIELREAAIALHASDVDAHLLLARDCQTRAQDARLPAAARKELWDKGERALVAAQHLDPYNPDGAEILAKYQYSRAQAGDEWGFRFAAANLERAITLGPNDVACQNLAAELELRAGHLDAARARVERSLAIDDRYPRAWILLGDIAIAQGDADAAQRAHETGIRAADRETRGAALFAGEGLNTRLSFYASKGRLEALLASIDDATARPDVSPTDTRVAFLHLAIGRACLELGLVSQAIEQLQRAQASAPDDYETLKELARAHLRAGDRVRAAECAARAREHVPRDDEAYWNDFVRELEAASSKR